MTNSEQSLYLRRLRFPPDMEARYRTWHYANIRNNLRIGVAPLIAFALFSGVRDYLYANVPVYAVGGNGGVIVLCLILLGLTLLPKFERVWQPVTVGLVWFAMTIMLNSPIVTGLHVNPVDRAYPANRPISSPSAAGRLTEPSAPSPPAPPPQSPGASPRDQMLLVQLYTLMIFLAAFRPGVMWAMLLNLGLIASAYGVLTVRLQASSQNLLMFAERSILVLFALMLSALMQERLARRAFLAQHLLDQERNDERRKREQTEGMLQVLGQAIGGIVHDLGNPLGAVQGGAQLLEQVIAEGETDAGTLKELTGIINDGANLLNYQRLSLMEQTRVLEGQPIPVDLKSTSLRQVLEMGVRYQNPKFAARRNIIMAEGDLQIQADAMKLVSVFMNLVGNALKYSDGDIHIFWQSHAGKALIAIADRGRQGRGITRAQASQLFVAFGRLETHTRMEGTGLGLLSVRKIVEAHGGEVFLEGYGEGTPASTRFTTAQNNYPSLLVDDLRTVFVVACPLAN